MTQLRAQNTFYVVNSHITYVAIILMKPVQQTLHVNLVQRGMNTTSTNNYQYLYQDIMSDDNMTQFQIHFQYQYTGLSSKLRGALKL